MKRFRSLAFALLALAAPAAALAQHPPPEWAEAARAEVAKLDKLVGHWKGSGWVMTPQGRQEVTSEERAEMRLEGRAIVVEGLHHDSSGKVVHRALGLIGWDARHGEYRFGTALATGLTGYHSGRIEDGRFVWKLDAPGPQRRFVIPLADRDTWEEYGEVSMDEGRTWRRFMYMKLERVK